MRVIGPTSLPAFVSTCAGAASGRKKQPSRSLDLKQQWEKQPGSCPYTGLALVQPSYKHRNVIQRTALLDRIDADQGYVPGNIQFVSMAINYAKSTLSYEQTVPLCRVIAAYWTNH